MGRQIAKRLNMDFEDSDHVIEECTGVDIPLIFEIEGEIGFRKRETTVLDALTNTSPLVLATGGGAVLAKENRHFLRNRGLVIYLHSDIQHLLTRVSRDKNRPLLHTADPAATLKDMMKIREPIYRELADIVINTGQQSIRNVVNIILSNIKDYNHNSKSI